VHFERVHERRTLKRARSAGRAKIITVIMG